MTMPTGGTDGCTSRTKGRANSSAMERLGASMMRGACDQKAYEIACRGVMAAGMRGWAGGVRGRAGGMRGRRSGGSARARSRAHYAQAGSCAAGGVEQQPAASSGGQRRRAGRTMYRTASEMHHIMTTTNMEKKRTEREREILTATTICVMSAMGASGAGALTISDTRSQEGISSYSICARARVGGGGRAVGVGAVHGLSCARSAGVFGGGGGGA